MSGRWFETGLVPYKLSTYKRFKLAWGAYVSWINALRVNAIKAPSKVV